MNIGELKGAWQSEEAFSDGTLRLLGFLWSLFEGDGPLLLEEPELSLNPAVIRYIPSMINRMQRRNNRQVFITTHSYDLLNETGVSIDEVQIIVPSKSGSEVKTATSVTEIGRLVDAGMAVGDAVLPELQRST